MEASPSTTSSVSRVEGMHAMGGSRVEASPPAAVYRSTSLKELGKEKGVIQTSLFTSPIKDAISNFSQDDLLKYWIEYANSLTNEKIHLKNTLKSCKPVLKENFTFEVAVYNPSQKDEIVDSNANIIGYLCNKLNNSRIKMDVLIAEKDEKEMIYTQTERYAYLIKKNPNIEKLTDIFNLTME